MSAQFVLKSFLITMVTIGSMVLSQSVNAADLNKAVNATSSRDYETAFSLWRDLANDGNPVAQYNLAMFYKRGYGVEVDSNKANRWLVAAARQGLVQAQRHILDAAVTPAKSVHLNTTLESKLDDPVEWVEEQNPRHYTLQVASSRNIDKIQGYYAEFGLRGKAGYYKSIRDGESWYNLVYGSYNSVSEAQAALNNLPQELRKWSPWVRKFVGVQRVITN